MEKLKRLWRRKKVNDQKMNKRWRNRISRHCFFIIFFSVSFISCNTLPKFKGEADLCGLIVDENNTPVKDFVIYCKTDFETNTALTDESGMFVIHGISSDVYTISGMKKNYAKLENEQFLFTDRSEIFCCQVESIEGAFKTVEEYILRGERKKAEEVIDSLYYDKKTPQEAVVLVYRFFLAEKNRDKKRIVSSIRKLGKIDDVDYSQYADALEGLIYED